MIQSFRPCKNPIYLEHGVFGSGKSTFAKRLLEALGNKLRPMIYELGFLRK